MDHSHQALASCERALADAVMDATAAVEEGERQGALASALAKTQGTLAEEAFERAAVLEKELIVAP